MLKRIVLMGCVLVGALYFNSCEKVGEIEKRLLIEENFEEEGAWQVNFDYLDVQMAPTVVSSDSGTRKAGNNIQNNELIVSAFHGIDDYSWQIGFIEIDDLELIDEIENSLGLQLEIEFTESRSPSDVTNYFELQLGDQSERWALIDSTEFVQELSLLDAPNDKLKAPSQQYLDIKQAFENSKRMRLSFIPNYSENWQYCLLQVKSMKLYALVELED